MSERGVLLVNLGSPTTLSWASVANYLGKFLRDPRVIDIHGLWRWPLVYGLIAPFRANRTRKSYEKIWDNGSPLIRTSKEFAAALQSDLGDEYAVALGMRYGEPSLKSALQLLEPCRQVLVVPLYPQYATSSTGTVLAEVFRLLGNRQWDLPAVRVVEAFYQEPAYLDNLEKLIVKGLEGRKWEHFLFSYHGLPWRHLEKSGCGGAQGECLKGVCPSSTSRSWSCYRWQCYRTSRLLAERLSWSEADYTVCFQSRLGKDPWLTPYTDKVLLDLRRRGVKDLALISPSFVSDCLETLEELDIYLQDKWKGLGGRNWTRISCLNTDSGWVADMAELIRGEVGIAK